MAGGRPIKKGLDYFHVSTSYNEKEDYLKKKCKGYGTYLAILKSIYGIEGYYCKWDDKTQVLFCNDGKELSKLKEIVECCFEIGLFNRHIFNKYSILTSSEIQRQYLLINHVCKRKSIPIYPDFDLVSHTGEDRLWRTADQIVNIYLMRVGDTDIYKIGYSSNPVKERLKTIRYYVPEIKLIDFVACEFKNENFLHGLFKHKNIEYKGFTEYFKFDHEDVGCIINYFEDKRNK